MHCFSLCTPRLRWQLTAKRRRRWDSEVLWCPIDVWHQLCPNMFLFWRVLILCWAQLSLCVAASHAICQDKTEGLDKEDCAATLRILTFTSIASHVVCLWVCAERCVLVRVFVYVNVGMCICFVLVYSLCCLSGTSLFCCLRACSHCVVIVGFTEIAEAAYQKLEAEVREQLGPGYGAQLELQCTGVLQGFVTTADDRTSWWWCSNDYRF